ncbi:KAT8 regulatory NSL complex subunit 1-like isoform X3 [Uloborus diversus]|uniref:KAT8 regulatory NSL complex subunit 1-like isoform X3 n=1 Tax=Uloborus diversus TaxID=327109 RepID=UPI0024095B11|nr:KAT8 regulatory NSL complex subunit 1-like isoform X3 [Uloborus diversus]
MKVLMKKVFIGYFKKWLWILILLEIPMGLHFENTLKLTEARYQTFQPVSPVEFRRIRFGNKTKHFSLLRNHSRKLNRYARSLLSVKYRNKHVQNSKHFRKHRLIFGKWRRLNRNKHSFHSRERIRRYSVVSSASSQDSPVPSPLSIFDDSSALDYMKKRRDDDQFDIDDVILPLNSKIGRAVERLQYKDITCPSWRREDKEGLDETEEIENISDAIFIQRHDRSEIEERKQLRSGPFGLNKRARRHRCDSRADSSGANTPDPVLLYNQDILFQMPTSSGTRPSSPALSPPNTPSSIAVISDDSQPSLGNGSVPSGFEKRKLSSQKRSLDENFPSRSASIEYDEVQPYAKRVYPLPDEEYELAVLASVHAQQEDADSPFSEPSCPASPESFTCSSSTSTVEEENDDDIADPEWTVHKNDPNSLVLKLSKR